MRYLVILFIFMISLTGCNKKDDMITEFHEPEVIEVDYELVGSYHAILDDTVVVSPEDLKGLIPSLSLYTNNTFGFSFDVLNSYFCHGTYEIQGDKCYMITDDGLYTYVFLVEEDGFKFIKEESASVELIDKNFGVQIGDGTFFVDDKKRSEYEVSE